MLVDDPVKRVDNMTMAWGLEGRVPFLDHELVELAAACPPELKLAGGGKGVLKDAARDASSRQQSSIGRRDISPSRASATLSGPMLARVRDALTNRRARERWLFNEAYVHRLFEAPNATRSTLGSNVLWQLGLLEMWLQSAVVE